MSNFIQSLLEGKYQDAGEFINEFAMKAVMPKLLESKKRLASEMTQQQLSDKKTALDARIDAAKKKFHGKLKNEVDRANRVDRNYETKKKVNEVSGDTLKNYIKKASDDASKRRGDDPKVSNRLRGIFKASSNLSYRKEKKKEINELSNDTLFGYIKKTSQENIKDATKRAKRVRGFRQASKRIFNNDYKKDAEQRDRAKLKEEDTIIEFEDGINLNEKVRVKIVKARVRKGKVQRRVRVSNVKGYTMRKRGAGPSRLTRMSPTERRKRKLGARRAKIKRRSKLSRMRQKRVKSMRKRHSIGLD